MINYAETKEVQELIELLKIDATSRNERGIADAVIPKLKEMGFDVHEDNAGEVVGGNCGNIIAVLNGELDGALMFTSHMDRVDNGYGIKPRIEGDTLVTDGNTILAADDLGGVMGIINGIREVQKSGRKLPTIEIVLTVCEEIGLFGAKALDISKLKSKFAYALDGSGRAGKVYSQGPCHAGLEIEVFGKSAHAGIAPENGINALVVMSKILANIRDGRLSPDSTANYSLISTGSKSVNIVCDYAKVTGETRSLHLDKLKDYISYFEDYCQKAVEGTGATVKTKYTMEYESFNLPHDCLCISLVKEAHAKLGITTEVTSLGGGMDANVLNSKGISCIGIATGYMHNHTPRETLYLEDHLNTIKTVENIILAYADHLSK